MITFTTKKKQKKKKTETLHEKLDTCDEKTRVHVYIFGYWSLRIIDRSRAWQSYKNRFNSTASIVTLESRMQGSLEWLFQVNCSMRDWFETRFELRSIPWVLLALNLPSKATSESDIQANYAGGWDKRRKVFERRWSPGTNPKTCSGVPSEPKVPMNWIFDLWWGWWRWRVCVCVCVWSEFGPVPCSMFEIMFQIYILMNRLRPHHRRWRWSLFFVQDDDDDTYPFWFPTYQTCET